MIYHEEIKDRFHLELGRMVHACARLDFNVDLTLEWLGSHHSENVSHLLVGRVPLAQRLGALKLLVVKTFELAAPKVLAEFEAWFAGVDELKLARNDYVHARWNIPGHCESDDPVFQMLPLTWEVNSEQQLSPTELSLLKFAEQVKKIEDATYQLGKLLNNYKAFIPLAKRLET